jgi:hypothetical protein
MKSNVQFCYIIYFIMKITYEGQQIICELKTDKVSLFPPAPACMRLYVDRIPGLCDSREAITYDYVIQYCNRYTISHT